MQVYIFLLLINSIEKKKKPHSFHQEEKTVTTDSTDLLTTLYLP